MQQFQDGQTKNIGGVTYVRQGGQWHAQGGGSPFGQRPVLREAPPQPTPRHPDQARKDELETIVLEGTIEERNEKRARGGLEPKQFGDLQGQKTAIDAFRTHVDELEGLYRQKLAGPDQGTILGLGGDRNVGGYLPGAIRPDNKTFNDRADGLINVLAPMLGLTGTELNSLGEIKARFGPMLPNSSDSDENIQIKLQGLRKLAEDQERAIAAQLGQDPAATQPPQTPQGGQPPVIGEQTDKTTVNIVGGQQGGRVAVDDGSEFLRVPDPALGGLNGQINEMMKRGAEPNDFLKLLRQQGVPPSEVMPTIMRAVQWRKKNPGYQGDYNVDVETKLQRQGAMDRTAADLAFSPVGAAGVAMGNVVTGNRLDNLAAEPEMANLGMQSLRETYPGASFAGDMAGGAGLYGAGRKALALAGRGGAPATGALSRPALAGDAAMGAHIASGADGTDLFSPTNALLGAVTGMAGGAVGRGAINTTARAISPSGGSLAPAYAEGAKPTIGQRMGGAFDRVEQAFASVPMVGGIQRTARNNAVEDWQAGAFNQALREIGTELPKGVRTGTAAHAYMQNQFNAAYNKARSGLTFRQDPEFVNDFRTIANEVAALSPQAQSRFASIVKQGENKLRARGGVLDGDDYKTLVSGIEKRIRSIRKGPGGDYELADVLEELSLALDSGARRHSNPAAVKALDAADRGYVKAVLIEEAGRKAGGGDFGEFTGKQLEAAVRKGSGLRSRRALRGEAPLQDYAAAGVRLGDSVPDSGTPERIMTTGGLASMAHFIDPLTLSPWFANTLANLPGGKQAINVLIAPNRKALDPARQALMKRAQLGGLLAAPATQNAVSP